MRDYHVPRTKESLVMWLEWFYGKEVPKFNRMQKKQLYAIYYRLREKGVTKK